MSAKGYDAAFPSTAHDPGVLSMLKEARAAGEGISFSDIRAFSKILYPGMSLRDYFAAQEQTTFVRSFANGPLGRLWTYLWWGPEITLEEAAQECYDMADAMLAVRNMADAMLAVRNTDDS